MLGLNTELVKAIATGHDLGHTPFGHSGEKIISRLMENNLWQIRFEYHSLLYTVLPDGSPPASMKDVPDSWQPFQIFSS